MTARFPLLPTSSVGSYAMPGWLFAAAASIRRGEFGERDVEELLEDAVTVAVQDQLRAGLDLITDGEMRRIDFNLGFYDRLEGIRPLPAARKLGVESHDMRGQWEIEGPIAAPGGLGIVEEFEILSRRVSTPVKAPVPGPFTLSGRLRPGTIYRDRMEIAQALVPILNQEMKRLVAAGATYIQLDEPSYAVYPDRPGEFVELFNQTVAGVDAHLGIHLCFGNFRGRPTGKRRYRPLFPHLFEMNVRQFVLEFSNREMAEAGLWSEFPNDRELAAGVIDVKNSYLETPEDVAERIRLLLQHVAPEKLWLVPDCGLSQTPRALAFRKLAAMVQGAEIVRRELAGRTP
jgi:5-methyltetrahydropteroyltriglutamate--homocysteine methyltransferase